MINPVEACCFQSTIKFVQREEGREGQVRLDMQRGQRTRGGLDNQGGRDRFGNRFVIAGRLHGREPDSAFRTWIAHGSLTSWVRQSTDFGIVCPAKRTLAPISTRA